MLSPNDPSTGVDSPIWFPPETVEYDPVKKMSTITFKVMSSDTKPLKETALVKISASPADGVVFDPPVTIVPKDSKDTFKVKAITPPHYGAMTFCFCAHAYSLDETVLLAKQVRYVTVTDVVPKPAPGAGDGA